MWGFRGLELSGFKGCSILGFGVRVWDLGSNVAALIIRIGFWGFLIIIIV